MSEETVPRHVFLVGCARTGSTLLRHVLNRSGQVAIVPETHFMRRAASMRIEAALAGADTDEAMSALVRRLYSIDRYSATGYWSWLRRNVPPRQLGERLAATDRSLRALFVILIGLYVERPEAEHPAPVVIGEKTPSHLDFVPTLVEWFPDARVVHTFRDPRAIYASELRRRRQGRWGAKRRWGRLPDWLVDPLLPPMQLVRTTLAWRRADRLDVAYRRRLGDRYRLVRFEDLVSNPEQELRAVCAQLGVAFDPALLDVDVVGSSFEERRHAAGGFDPATAERWREHVGRLARAWFRVTLGRRLRARGYAP